MDPSGDITHCKENIQPLRHGRNLSQLGTALRAQENPVDQELLLQEKQMYEDAINNYEGDDLLENWYEYIMWAEQSYPKNGNESHIGKLLEQCLAIFEKKTEYHQDRRLVRLWINYIGMQKHPVELYQLAYNNGIGAVVADLYRAWAFELEQIGDYKRADKVYFMGLSANAEPRDELAKAHKNFQVAALHKTLGRSEVRSESSIYEERQAFSSLRAISSGRKVSNVRTGHRVRDHFPGAVSQVAGSMHNSEPNSRIQIYQDDTPSEMEGPSILGHVPIGDAVHKENILKAGPWSSGAKQCPLILSQMKSAFKVHEDQLQKYDGEKVQLFPNHICFFDGSNYPEHSTVPVLVPDMPNPNITSKTHYPKKLVYHDNMDLSMEEIKAQTYLKRRAQRKQQEENATAMEQQCFENPLRDDRMHTMMDQYEGELPENQRLKTDTLQDDCLEMQRLEAERVEAQRREAERIEAQRREAERIEAQRRKAERIEARRLEAERIELRRLEAQRREAKLMEARRYETQRIEAQRVEAEILEAQRMEAELNSQQKLHPSNFMHAHHPSSLPVDPEESTLGLTMNSKEALSMVQDMWQSYTAFSNNSPYRPPVTPRMPAPLPKLSFDIHLDGSMTQHAMTSNKQLPSYVQSYNDPENHPNYSMAHQSYSNQDHDSPYRLTIPPDVSPHQPLQSPPKLHNYQRLPYASPLHAPVHLDLYSPAPQMTVYSQSPTRQSSMCHQPHAQQHQQHHSPHNQHLAHQQHQHQQHQHMQHMLALPNQLSYQQNPSSLESSMIQQNVDQKHLSYQPYPDPQVETSKPYKMPQELPYIKSPGMNRRDLEYLEGAENKENSIVVDYNNPIEENMPKAPDENNFNNDASFGMNSLNSNNETCYMTAFSTQLSSSTPMTGTFRQPYKMRDQPSYGNQCENSPTLQRTREDPVDPEDKLSVILESTREYISSSSNSSTHTRTLGFTMLRDDLVQIKEESLDQFGEDKQNDTLIAPNQSRDQMLYSQIQAVHAQSPRTVQRNVDQITSDIKTNCDLRKSISFRLNEADNHEKVDVMECEENEPMEQTKEEEPSIPFELPSGIINPFDKELVDGLLRNLKFPQPHHAEGYVELNLNLNRIVPSSVVKLGNDTYNIKKCLGKGMYGTVFTAVCANTGETFALKTQRPAWVWEYYITREIKNRLTNPHMLRGFMDVTRAYKANNCSVLASQFSKYGTLLAVTNEIKVATGKPLCEHLAIFFTIEVLQIVEYLHKCQIIHADIKPDNFLLMQLPSEDARPTLQLIDFGCSIDMRLFPDNTTFTKVIKTEDFTCIEMQTGRPWTYQTDLYCLAATCHCLLFGNYMRVVNTDGRWFITSKIPRYAKKAAWGRFFDELLNVESCENLPDLGKLRNMMEETLAQMTSTELRIRHFVNILNKR